MGNLLCFCAKKENNTLLSDKKCIHCCAVFTSAKKRRKHELICPQKSDNQQALNIYQ